jgi:peptidoglycan/LPS O-acetylase OafA/YrhL
MGKTTSLGDSNARLGRTFPDRSAYRKESALNRTPTIAADLVWVDMLKGIAIVGVVFDHWIPYWRVISSSPRYVLLERVPWGAPVELFFLLSGFGLMTSYLNRRPNWSWIRWAWRRLTKIVIPYWFAVAFTFVLGLLTSSVLHWVNLQFSWMSLIAYLTFTRAFFPLSWPWNIALWFMPIIIGLYVCFPIMATFLVSSKKWIFLLVSSILTYGSIYLSFIISGRYRGHHDSLFLFFILEFAVGMILAYARFKFPESFNKLIGLNSFFAGCAFCLLSWVVLTFVPGGNAYDDALVEIGSFLCLLNLIWLIRISSKHLTEIFRNLVKRSYLIFLIHYPILAFVLGPNIRVTLHPIVIVASGLLFISGVYYLCSLISKPVDKYTSWLFGLFKSSYAR